MKDLEGRAKRRTSAESVHIFYQELCILIKVKLRKAFLRTLLACSRKLFISVLIYIYIYIYFNLRHLSSGHATCSLREQGCEICGYFSKPKGVREQKPTGNTGLGHYH